jgi:hypothetical protein
MKDIYAGERPGYVEDESVVFVKVTQAGRGAVAAAYDERAQQTARRSAVPLDVLKQDIFTPPYSGDGSYLVLTENAYEWLAGALQRSHESVFASFSEPKRPLQLYSF